MSRSFAGLAAVVVAVVLSAPPAFADVTGKVTFAGPPPAREPLPGVMDDAYARTKHKEPPRSEAYVVAADGGLANAVVYLKGDLPPRPPVEKQVRIRQVGCIYVPHVVSATTGQDLVFVSGDDVPHYVNAPWDRAVDRNYAQYKAGESFTWPLKAPGYEKFTCNIHPWMAAWAATFPHPYHAVSAADGTFRIDAAGLPDGDYAISVWHEKLKDDAATGTVTVKGGNGTCNLVVKAKPTPRVITGRVTFAGPPPPRQPLAAAMQDPNVRILHKEPPLDERIVVAKDGGLANAVVYLAGDLKGAPPNDVVVFETVKGMYEPHVVSATVGQRAEVRNRDPFLHNTNVQAVDNPGKGMAQPVKRVPDLIPIKVPEFYKIVCNVHPWMNAWVAVFPHPYHAVTAADGTFAIATAGLKDGEYEVVAWQEKLKDRAAVGRVTVRDGTASIDLLVRPPPPTTRPTADPTTRLGSEPVRP